MTGSYDPELNLTYWGVGNPGPDWNGDDRTGDNLYSDCVVALDADTGKLKWYYQFSPHDEFDYDAVQVPVLVDGEWQGKPRKMMMWANRNGLFYVLDRTSGQFLLRKAVRQGDVDERVRRARPANESSQRRVQQQGHADLPRQPGRDQLVQPVLQPAHGFVLHSHLGRLFVAVRQAGPEIPGGPVLRRRRASRQSDLRW